MINLPWEVHVPDEYVIAGNAAVLRCVVPAHCSERVSLTEWLTDDEVSVLHYLGKALLSPHTYSHHLLSINGLADA